MKEFDIEKLKRENVFTEPEGFYENMQSNVLKKVVPVSRGRIINLNWAYGAAAAIALLVGVSVVINSDPAIESQPMTQIVPVEKPATYELAEVETSNNEPIEIINVEENLTSLEQIHPKRKAEINHNTAKVNASIATKKEKVVAPSPEIQVDQILASFTSADMANVGKNTEQDIYLDLYN